MKVAALIPVRGGSKSIPNKNIRLLAGRPLLYWTLDAACECALVDKVFVATDSTEIAKVAAAHGHPKVTVISRSAETATDTATTESVMVEFAGKYSFEHLLLIQATSPLLRTVDLTGGLTTYFERGADSLLSVVRQKRFLWQADTTGFFHPINYHPEHRPRRQSFAGILVENGAFYVTRRDALLAANCRISGRTLCHEMPEESYIELDEPRDWEIVERLLHQRLAEKVSRFPREIRLVLTDVDGVLTDGGMYYGANGESLKKFNTRDGMGFELLRSRGIRTGIITRESTDIVAKRASKIKADILIQGCQDKGAALEQLLAAENLQPAEVAYIGDDVNDLAVLGRVGFAGAPCDAEQVARDCAHFICRRAGGHGCFREFADAILQGQAADLMEEKMSLAENALSVSQA